MPFDDNNKQGIVDRLIVSIIREKKNESVCKSCGTWKNLTIHHKDRDRLRRYDLENIEILCESCHKKLHQGVHN